MFTARVEWDADRYATRITFTATKDGRDVSHEMWNIHRPREWTQEAIDACAFAAIRRMGLPVGTKFVLVK